MAGGDSRRSCSLFFHGVRRQSVATPRLRSHCRKQRIDFGIIQPLQRSSQILRQEVACLRSLIVLLDLVGRDRFRRLRRRGSRKQVGCCPFRPVGWHNANYAVGVAPGQSPARELSRGNPLGSQFSEARPAGSEHRQFPCLGLPTPDHDIYVSGIELYQTGSPSRSLGCNQRCAGAAKWIEYYVAVEQARVFERHRRGWHRQIVGHRRL
jgi:hypothetical protein